MLPEATHNLSELLNLGDGDIVAVIGAGGKHTFMYQVSQELVAAGRTVVLTSTTNLHRSAEYARLSTLLTACSRNWQSELGAVLADQQRAVLVDDRMSANMYRGFGPAVVEQISAASPRTVVLVKADGARKLWLKAPAGHEPVFPDRLDVCVLVLSLAAIGRPLDENHVHRLERVRALTKGSVITTRTLVDVITGPGGYQQRLPRRGRNVLYLSCCDGPAAFESARVIAKQSRSIFHRQLCGDTIARRFYVLGGESA